MKVRDVMTTGVVAVRGDAPLKEAVRLLERHGISGLPVVDEFGAVVGVLSEADLLSKELGRGEAASGRFAWLRPERARAERRRIEATMASDAMTRPAVVVGPNESVRAAARLMVERRVNRLPVVQRGALVGIVTRGDIARTFLRPDEDIAAAVRAEIVRGAFGIDPATLGLRVLEGVVRIGGRVPRRTTAEILVRLLERLPGVVAVESALTWDFDDHDLDVPPRDLVNLPWARG